MNIKKGYTLIETIIYISLFSLLITGGIIGIQALSKSISLMDNNIYVQGEVNFILNKITWALSGISTRTLPILGGSGCNQTLTIYKTNTPYPIKLRLNTTKNIEYIEMQEDGTNFYPLSTENIKIECLKFSILQGTPFGIMGTTTINKTEYVFIKYARI